MASRDTRRQSRSCWYAKNAAVAACPSGFAKTGSTLMSSTLEGFEVLTRRQWRAKNKIMSREQIIATLRSHEQALKNAGVVRVSLFGSAARDEAGADSDIDIAVRLGEGFSSGGFDYFWRLEQLERRLSEMLGARVDIVAEPVRKDRFQDEIDRDRALAF
jgi:predicted nucleotidyltransferase